MRRYLELIRFFQPTGFILLFLSGLFGIIFAIYDQNINIEIIRVIALFLVGSFIMRSAGCIINDIADRNFDNQVARTKNRPITSGQVSISNALILLAILLFIGLIILLQFNKFTVCLGFLSIIFIILYPFFKRFTYYPQFILGITFNFAILMGYSAIKNEINLSVILLYFVGLIWTVIYDTIYAFSDIDDDLKIGIKSTAIKFSKTPKFILIFLGLVKIVFLIMIAVINNFHYTNFFLIFFYLLFFIYQILSTNLKNKKNSINLFKRNIYNGIIIIIILIPISF